MWSRFLFTGRVSFTISASSSSIASAFVFT
jgi:hypothetical protein